MTELERKQDRAPIPADWAYAPAPESREIVRLRERYGFFIGGEWVEPKETYTTIDPASEEPLAEVGQWLHPYEHFWRERLRSLRDVLDEEFS